MVGHKVRAAILGRRDGKSGSGDRLRKALVVPRNCYPSLDSACMDLGRYQGCRAWRKMAVDTT